MLRRLRSSAKSHSSGLAVASTDGQTANSDDGRTWTSRAASENPLSECSPESHTWIDSQGSRSKSRDPCDLADINVEFREQVAKWRASTPQSQTLSSAAHYLVNFAVDNVRALLPPELARMFITKFKPLLHYLLCAIGAIIREENIVPTTEQIEDDLVQCLKRMSEFMNKRSTDGKLQMESVLDDLQKYCEISGETDRYSSFVGAINGALKLLQSLEIGNAKASPPSNHGNYLVFMVNDPNLKSSYHGEGFRSTRKTDIDITWLRHVRSISEYRTLKFEKLTDEFKKTKKKKSTTAVPWLYTLGCCEMKAGKPTLKSGLQAIKEFRQGASPGTLTEVDIVPGAEIKASTEKEIGGIKDELAIHNEKLEKAKKNQKAGSSKRYAADDESADDEPPPKLSKGLDGKSTSPSSVNRKPSTPILVDGATPAASKVPSLHKLSSLPAQIAEYAAESMYNGFGRNHVMNFAIEDEILHIWYFDHQGPIQSYGIHFVRDLPYFLLLLYALQRLNQDQWGYISELHPLNTTYNVELSNLSTDTNQSQAEEGPSGAANPADADTANPSNAKKVKRKRATRITMPKKRKNVTKQAKASEIETTLPPKKSRSRSKYTSLSFTSSEKEAQAAYKVLGLSGRGTCVVPGTAEHDGVGIGETVIKLSYREAERTPEAVFIAKAKQLCEGNGFKDFCAYLPDILFEKEYPQYSTLRIRRYLNATTETGEKASSKAARVPYLIAMPRYDPITVRTKDWYTFMNDFIKLFFVHALLWSLGIQHGDISEKNLMWDPASGKPKLCDYDLAHLSTDTEPSGSSNTGTWRFMALELLSKRGVEGKIPRRYRHDVESFIAVLIWILCRFRDGRPILKNPKEKGHKPYTDSRLLQDWNQVEFEKIRSHRESTYIEILDMRAPEGVPDDIWQLCTSFYASFRRAILDCAPIRAIEEFHEEIETRADVILNIKYNSIHFIKFLTNLEHKNAHSRIIAKHLMKFSYLKRIGNFIGRYKDSPAVPKTGEALDNSVPTA